MLSRVEWPKVLRGTNFRVHTRRRLVAVPVIDTLAIPARPPSCTPSTKWQRNTFDGEALGDSSHLGLRFGDRPCSSLILIFRFTSLNQVAACATVAYLVTLSNLFNPQEVRTPSHPQPSSAVLCQRFSIHPLRSVGLCSMRISNRIHSHWQLLQRQFQCGSCNNSLVHIGGTEEGYHLRPLSNRFSAHLVFLFDPHLVSHNFFAVPFFNMPAKPPELVCTRFYPPPVVL
mmetsp:Transcript_6630/g.10161  ORF Transcript_6630/g.10161 Transcript_6630/m.10161 type:complete len:229 (+) Transcript_6630:449-1135(+)